jgi:hypothetical protein
MSLANLPTVIGRGVTGVINTCHSIPNSTWLLELDKFHDHETHVERHSKHFKKQRKPYLLIFVKKPWETLGFRVCQYRARIIIVSRARVHRKNRTCIALGKIQGETYVGNSSHSRAMCDADANSERAAREKKFLKTVARESHSRPLHALRNELRAFVARSRASTRIQHSKENGSVIAHA